MTQELRDAIRTHPGDDHARLVYADWLDDQGDSDRAAFIRIQIARHQLEDDAPEQVTLELQARALQERREAKWREALPDLDANVTWGEFDRGFVRRIGLGNAELWHDIGRKALDATLVTGVTLPWPRMGTIPTLHADPRIDELTVMGTVIDDREVRWLANSPLLASVRRLTLTASDLRTEHLRILLGSPHLDRLDALCLPWNLLDDAAIDVLVERDLQGLVELDLSTYTFSDFQSQGRDTPTMGAAAMERLAAWPGLACLKRLVLNGIQMERPGLRAIVQSPHVRALEHLGIFGISDWIVGAGEDPTPLVPLRDASPALRLRSLEVGDFDSIETPEQDNGLANSPALRQLRTLQIAVIRSAITFRVLPFLSTLRRLNLDRVVMTTETWSQWIPSFEQLHSLQVNAYFSWARSSDLLSLLAEGPPIPTLRRFALCDSQLDSQSLLRFGESHTLPALEALWVSGQGYQTPNQLDEQTAKKFLQTQLGKSLTSAEFGHPSVDRLPEPHGPNMPLHRLHRTWPL
ncbi:MAG: TIGR02996 domain-containing protein [Myxococcota bacterium]